MSEILLTNSADSLLKAMYSEYLTKVKDGLSSTESSCFGEISTIRNTFFPNSHPDDVRASVFMLKTNGLIYGRCGDNTLYEIHLTSKGIAYCENRWKRNLSELRDWLSAIGGLLPI